MFAKGGVCLAMNDHMNACQHSKKWLNKSVIITLFALSLTFCQTALPTYAAENPQYKDIKNSYWAYNAIVWASKADIVTGFKDGSFKPERRVSEQEFLSMLMRSYGEMWEIPQVQLATQSPTWSNKYYQNARFHRYPVSNSTSRAREQSIDRQYAAELITSTQGLYLEGNDAINYLLENKMSNGKTSPTIAGYRGQDFLTRAEAVTFINSVVVYRKSNTLLDRPYEPNSEQFAQQVLFLVNEARVDAGLEPLALDARLTQVARDKVKDMRDLDYFDHESPVFGLPFKMMETYGINYRWAGENLAAGQLTPEAVMKGWMESEDHRENILSPYYSNIGIAYTKGKKTTAYRTYWAQEFSSPNSR
jgi:uncharacterized YkwD family protein